MGKGERIVLGIGVFLTAAAIAGKFEQSRDSGAPQSLFTQPSSSIETSKYSQEELNALKTFEWMQKQENSAIDTVSQKLMPYQEALSNQSGDSPFIDSGTLNANYSAVTVIDDVPYLVLSREQFSQPDFSAEEAAKSIYASYITVIEIKGSARTYMLDSGYRQQIDTKAAEVAKQVFNQK